MQNLSERLKVIASFVKKGAKVCDVGTDHAYLPIFLLKERGVASVIATDIREKPLANAKKNIERSGIDNIGLRLCDGLAGVGIDEADTVIIAGMGGEVISGILSRCEWIKNARISLILQPMTSPEILRKYLCENAFLIEREECVFDNGKIYSVISARYSGQVKHCEEWYYYIGEVNSADENGAVYIRKQLNRIKACADALRTVEEKKQEYRYYNLVAKALEEKLNGV